MSAFVVTGKRNNLTSKVAHSVLQRVLEYQVFSQVQRLISATYFERPTWHCMQQNAPAVTALNLLKPQAGKVVIMQNAADIRVLLVTPDPSLVTDFTNLCGELGIEAQSSASTHKIPEELAEAKYEVVLVDFDRVPET